MTTESGVVSTSSVGAFSPPAPLKMQKPHPAWTAAGRGRGARSPEGRSHFRLHGQTSVLAKQEGRVSSSSEPQARAQSGRVPSLLMFPELACCTCGALGSRERTRLSGSPAAQGPVVKGFRGPNVGSVAIGSGFPAGEESSGRRVAEQPPRACLAFWSHLVVPGHSEG